MDLEGEARELLRRLTGHVDAASRPGQLEAIEHLVERRGRVLVVQRTGWGNELVHQLQRALAAPLPRQKAS